MLLDRTLDGWSPDPVGLQHRRRKVPSSLDRIPRPPFGTGLLQGGAGVIGWTGGHPPLSLCRSEDM